MAEGEAMAQAMPIQLLKMNKPQEELAAEPVILPTKIAYREKQFVLLKELLCKPWEKLPSCLLVIGQADTGKSLVVLATLEAFPRRCRIAWVDCRSCYTLGLLFQSLLNQLAQHTVSSQGSYKSYQRCDCMAVFITALKEAARVRGNSFRKKKIFIVLDHCERIIPMNENLLSLFARMQELTGLEVTVLMITQVTLDPGWFHSLPIIIYFPQYSQAEMLEILVSERPDNVDASFYAGYVKIIVDVFFRDCRHLGVIRQKVLAHFPRASTGDTNLLQVWKRLAPMLRNSLDRLHQPYSAPSESTATVAEEYAQSLELPFYAKYLLIAAFIASHNHQSTDVQLFCASRQGTRARRRVPAKRRARGGSVLLPPSFPVERLFALFYAIVEERLPFTVQLQAQVSTLVKLELLRDTTNNLLTERKLSCLASGDLVAAIARSVEFDLEKYLT